MYIYTHIIYYINLAILYIILYYIIYIYNTNRQILYIFLLIILYILHNISTQTAAWDTLFTKALCFICNSATRGKLKQH